MTPQSRLIDAGQVASQRVHEFERYWSGKAAGGQPPRRAAIDPVEIPRLLPYLIIADIERTPFRVRYRLVGTRVAEANGSDFTNRYLDACGFTVEVLLTECYRRVVATRAPVFAHYEWHRKDWRRPRGAIGSSETGFFPLSSDGVEIDGAISLADCDARPYQR